MDVKVTWICKLCGKRLVKYQNILDTTPPSADELDKDLGKCKDWDTLHIVEKAGSGKPPAFSGPQTFNFR